ncbi:ThiF family adenylyltransferase [Helicobacter cappadocius]|uniref:ThiF family adenylyltransferase n=2 Tax=Helicobacter cappadocius TaxID=3063998 RepID=A0AA90T9S3_9HELI|nr:MULTISPECIES: ThiF family adenylyltransferase [unclassified Helicobacter]MDO7253213.1 ThiF family adenylyltransferase [Helicobacter sp. faydin-H75]MDP2539137.1 ThiF family adenylyltransferase [Helicobacter sp. faydin-H76]
MEKTMEDRFTRTRFLFGEDFELFTDKRVIIFGIGGVGGFALDCLYRTGIGHISIVDKDSFDITNQNRQIGSHKVGEDKVEVLAEIYPGITPIKKLVDMDFLDDFDVREYDYVIDAIDDIPAKVLLAKKCSKMPYGTYISSTGSAKKLNPLEIKVDSVWKSYGDKFARKFRDLLKKENFSGDFKVIFSPENPRCKPLGSFSAVTGSFGLQIGSEVIRDILSRRK